MQQQTGASPERGEVQSTSPKGFWSALDFSASYFTLIDLNCTPLPRRMCHLKCFLPASDIKLFLLTSVLLLTPVFFEGSIPLESAFRSISPWEQQAKRSKNKSEINNNKEKEERQMEYLSIVTLTGHKIQPKMPQEG